MTYLAKQGTITDTEVIGLNSQLSMRPDPSTPLTKFIVDRFIGSSADGSYNFDVTSLSCNSATIGAGGRLSGISFNTDTIYYVYLLGDSTNTNPDAVGFDTAEPAPTTLPAGYDQYKLIGSQITDSVGPSFIGLKKSADFVEFMEPQLVHGPSGGPVGQTTRFVTLMSSNYSKKIYLRVYWDGSLEKDTAMTYRAHYVEQTSGNGQFIIDFQVHGDSSADAWGQNTWHGWVDIITLAGVRSFVDQLAQAANATTTVWVVGHQELT